MKQIKNFLYNEIDWKEFLTSMLIFLAYFTLIAIIMLATGTWKFDWVLIYFYGCGIGVSFIINIFKQIR